MTIFADASPIHGNGVFTEELIPEGTELDIEYDVLDAEDVEEIRHNSFEGWYPRGEVWVYLNHSETPNAEIGADGKTLFIVALRDIQPGEEILIDYGKEYWGDSQQDEGSDSGDGDD